MPPKDLKNPSFWKRFNATTEEELLCSARKKYTEDNFFVDRLLRSSKTKLTFEKTPNYMFLPQVPELIYNTCPWHPKIILILRNPVDRAYSHFMMDLGKTRVDEGFEKYIQQELQAMHKVGISNAPILSSDWDPINTLQDHLFDNPPNNMTREQSDHAHWMVYRIRHIRNYLQRGIYSVQLERWIKFFPLNESLLVINNERFTREPRKVMGEVLRFLGSPQPDYFSDLNVSVSLKEEELLSRRGVSNLLSVGGYAPMSNSTRRFLEKFYKPYNDQVADLLGEEWRGVWGSATSTT